MRKQAKRIVLLPGWWFEVLVIVLALVVLGVVIRSGSSLPRVEALGVFIPLVLLASNSVIVLPSRGTVSPAFMTVMAAMTAFAGRGTALGCCVVGAGAGATMLRLRERRLTTFLFNCAQNLIAAVSAGTLYEALGGGTRPLAFVTAGLCFALINTSLVLPQLSLNMKTDLRQVWNNMWPNVPNYLAFGFLGLVVGELYRSLGPVAVPLVVVPGAIARKTFGAFLELQAAHEATAQVFVRAIEAKDPYTAGHTERVAKYALYIAEELGLTPARREHLRYAALMHDIGKLAVPTALLNKPGRLTPEEYAIVQRHNEVCIDILTRVDFMKTMVVAASDRHARYDEKLTDESGLVLEAYIVSVADAFDAMTSTRSYRRALTQETAFAELTDKSGKQFDPRCVAALMRAIERRGEQYGLGFEHDTHGFQIAPPVVGVGSAGLGDLDRAEMRSA